MTPTIETDVSLIRPDAEGKFPTPLDGALFMASLGIPQTPLRPFTKIPFLTNFPALATTDPEQIRKWAAQYPNCNFGSVGRVGEYFVFEADTPDVHKRFKATGNQFTAKLSVASRPDNSRGHRWYKYTPGVKNIQQAFTTHNDFSVRAENMQSVSPGSIHPDTREQYRLISYGVPEVPTSAEIAFWESEQVEKKQGEKKEAPRNAAGKIPKGSVHGWMLTQAGRMRNAGLIQDEIETALLRLVHDQCEPPINEDRVRAMARSICNYEPGSAGYALMMNRQPDDAANPTKTVSESELDTAFPFYDGIESDDLPMLVEGFMPEGVTFFGSLSGTGKTWVGLSIAKALTTGNPLWGVFPVVEKTGVLFLIPETSDGAFKRRLKKLGITQDKTRFRYRTITQGMAVPLRDPATVAAVKYLQGHNRKVLVIVDTAVRFLSGADENSAKENTLVLDSDVLRSIGASILFQHHAPKATKDAAELTLENVLRGTGDFGAMSDAVYGLRRDEKLFAYNQGPEQIDVVCVKPRDFDPPAPFRLELKRKPLPNEIVGDKQNVSVIDEIGDLRYIGSQTLKHEAKAKLATIFGQNPYISFNSLVDDLKMNRTLVKDFVFANGGWKQVFVREPNAKGVMVQRRKWKTGLLVGGESLADESAIPANAISGKVLEFHHPAKPDTTNRAVDPLREDPAQGF